MSINIIVSSILLLVTPSHLAVHLVTQSSFRNISKTTPTSVIQSTGKSLNSGTGNIKLQWTSVIGWVVLGLGKKQLKIGKRYVDNYSLYHKNV